MIVGCGDVGLRVLRLLLPRWRVLALTSSPERMPLLRALGAVPLWGDLDQPASLGRLGGLADSVLHLAPPPAQGTTDARTRSLLHALARGGTVQHLVYCSTSGVYGDCQGQWVPETRGVQPLSDRAWRRVDAEAHVRLFGRQTGARVSVLRVPGIYGLDRPGGNPAERLARHTPALRAQDDVFTNHIHADDLARACMLALWRGRAQRTYNVSDDTELKMGDYYDAAADLYGLPRPPRVPRSTAADALPLMLLSFMSESRRLLNARMKRELRLSLRYPTVLDGLRAGVLAGAQAAPPGAVTRPTA